MLLEKFLDTTYDHTKDGINLAVKDFNYIYIYKTAKQSKLKTKTDKITCWYQKLVWSRLPGNSQTPQKSVKKYKDPNNTEIRLLYCETLKQYKQTIRTKKSTIYPKTTNNYWEVDQYKPILGQLKT